MGKYLYLCFNITMPIMLVSHCWLVACVLLLVTCSFVLNATTIRTKNSKHLVMDAWNIVGVELEGIEPSSKQGNHTLSTRLFRPSVFVPPQDPDHQRRPYPLKLHHTRGAGRGYSRFNRTACSERFGTTASGRCLVLSPCDGIKPVIYYASIRQRERTCFRQINL